MKKICYLFAAILFCVVSCRTQKVKKLDYDLISVKMNRCDILDTLAVDSMIQKSQQMHKNHTGYTAHCLEFRQWTSNSCLIFSNSTYNDKIMNFEFEPTFEWRNGVVHELSFAYYDGMILLISNLSFPSSLFKKTEEWDYVMLFSDRRGGFSIECEFDSTYKFVKSVNYADFYFR
ncbi:MAG: hypothetical protein J6S89_01425 [Paludibacteraceae bacterium]|nr:hypothetical protein [Paludibacteraceae bacterium]